MYSQVHRFLRQQAKLSTAVDAAYAEPNKDPPRAEQRDDTVEEMIGRISLHVCLNNLIGYKAVIMPSLDVYTHNAVNVPEERQAGTPPPRHCWSDETGLEAGRVGTAAG